MRIIITCTAVCLLASSMTSAAEAARVWRSDPLCRVVRVAKAPPVDPDASGLADDAWKQAEMLGPLTHKGVPESAERRTEVRMMLAGDTLLIGVRCHEPDPAKITKATKAEQVWQADSVELLLTQGEEAAFPFLHLAIDAGGTLHLVRYVQPFGTWAHPLLEKPDPSHIRKRAGIDAEGWWAVLEIPLKQYGIAGLPIRANVVRNRTGEKDRHGWVDLWDGRFQRVKRMGRLVAADAPLAPLPRLKLPDSLAVGENTLHVDNPWKGLHLLVDGTRVEVKPDGTVAVSIRQPGPIELMLLFDEPRKTILDVYAAEVRRPLVVSSVLPFIDDADAPILVKVTVNVVGKARVEVEAVQDGKVSGRVWIADASGEYEVAVPHEGTKPGEVQLIARIENPAVEVRHWCVLGKQVDEFNRFRPGIEKLATREMFRAAVCDAAAYYRLIQDGNGEVRSGGRRGYNFRFWNQGFIYVLALAYKADWPENPHRGNRQFLDATALAMEAALEPERWQTMIDFPPNRNLQGWLLAYDLVKDDVSRETRERWKDGLVRLVESVVDCWVYPSSLRGALYSEDVGTGTNHWAYHAANVYTAGRIFGRDDWVTLGGTMMRRLAAHAQDGQFPERRGIPASRYTWLTMGALGEYYWQSKDASVLPSLLRCADYGVNTSLPDGGPTLLHDGRVNDAHTSHYGDFVLSLKPEGRALTRVRALTYINADRTPARTSPEQWYRAAETAVYMEPGDEKPLGEDAEFPFLDGRGLVARKSGHVYGLSAISLVPITGLFRLDAQNAVEWHHVKAGCVLNGANSQAQPEAGSFMRTTATGTEWLPKSGVIERTRDGHVARLQFDTFEAQVTCRVLSPTRGEVRVDLVRKDGDGPVLFSFFPGVGWNWNERAAETVDLSADLSQPPGAGGLTLSFRNVKITTNRPVTLDRDLAIYNPYSGRRGTRSKPVRAYAELEVTKPLVLRIVVEDPR